jgi:hypothetical protein
VCVRECGCGCVRGGGFKGTSAFMTIKYGVLKLSTQPHPAVDTMEISTKAV